MSGRSRESSLATACSTGAKLAQAVHHGAWNSTSVCQDLPTWSSKVRDVRSSTIGGVAVAATASTRAQAAAIHISADGSDPAARRVAARGALCADKFVDDDGGKSRRC